MNICRIACSSAMRVDRDQSISTLQTSQIGELRSSRRSTISRIRRKQRSQFARASKGWDLASEQAASRAPNSYAESEAENLIHENLCVVLALVDALVDSKDGKLTGAEVDAVIERAVAVKAAKGEAQRRRGWSRHAQMRHRLSRTPRLAELGH
jgi:hypothetical protein